VRRGFRLGLTFTFSSRFNVVIAGLVPAISFSWARRCVPERDHRDIRAFTPVFAGYAR
jgi:hypothetical protein